MSTYPNLKQSTQSNETRLLGRQLDRATNGAPKVRQMFPTRKKTFSVVHEFLTPAQKATLEAFYLANQYLVFDFVWIPDTLTYQCIFDENPPTFAIVQGNYWTATVTMVET